ncbi:MAG: metalloregulator ArsR/SmtB family transcription factor [Peptococcaceae bacterium]|nr:metalloregulator ArsR/SmtB family transcription factor [Peptococcaceae bacterium]
MTKKPEQNDALETCEVFSCREDLTAHVKNNALDTSVLERLAELFKALGDPTRVRILWALSMHEMCVCELAEALDMTQSAVSHQLRLLRTAKLISNRREGRSIYYSLADAHVSLLFSQGLEHVQEKEGM